jgi:hypothetical protein
MLQDFLLISRLLENTRQHPPQFGCNSHREAGLANTILLAIHCLYAIANLIPSRPSRPACCRSGSVLISLNFLLLTAVGPFRPTKGAILQDCNPPRIATIAFPADRLVKNIVIPHQNPQINKSCWAFCYLSNLFGFQWKPLPHRFMGNENFRKRGRDPKVGIPNTFSRSSDSQIHIGFNNERFGRSVTDHRKHDLPMPLLETKVRRIHPDSGTFSVDKQGNVISCCVSGSPGFIGLPTDDQSRKKANHDQQPCKKYEPPLYIYIFIGAGCILIGIRGACPARPIYRAVVIVLSAIGLLTDLGACALGNPLTFWRFHWLLDEEDDCQNNRALNAAISK